MEDSQGKQENEQTTSEPQLDTVDYKRLSRLSAGAERATDEAQPQLRAHAQQSWETAPAAAPQSPTAAQRNRPFAESVTAAPASQKSYVPVIVIAIIVLLLLLSVSIGIYSLKTMSQSGTPANNTQPPQDENKNTQTPASKANMVAIKGGTFQMGRSDGAEQEGPPHTVTVASFSIDRTEVTNDEYAQFVKSGAPPPSHFINGKPVSGQEQLPVTNVSFEDAKAFAAWRSKRDGVTYRLPTEEEWEYAARDGSQGTIFPWGNAWADGKANISSASLNPVGASPGDKTRAGVLDMIGNAYEWTQSKASYYPGNKLQVNSSQTGWMVIRGGAYITDISKKKVSATYRDWIPPSTVNAGLGFRLVRAQ